MYGVILGVNFACWCHQCCLEGVEFSQTSTFPLCASDHKHMLAFQQGAE